MGKEFIDWGVIPYAEAWERQALLFEEVIRAKSAGEIPTNRIIFCEHPHVYTLGKSGKAGNMLLTPPMLEKFGATLYHIDRGGDITYHGPGQLVCYPILDLEGYGLGLKTYIALLEDAVIRVCGAYGIAASRLEGATGVWIGTGTPAERKICAIGVRASRYVTMHGLALNVSTNLDYFNHIHPCGFIDKGVTSIRKETGKEILLEEVKQQLRLQLDRLLV